MQSKQTKSQKLRAVLYLMYHKDPKGFKSFELFYEDLMEKIINFYKSKL